jgi:hypothetical protein
LLSLVFGHGGVGVSSGHGQTEPHTIIVGADSDSMIAFMGFDGKFQIVAHTTSFEADWIVNTSFIVRIAMMASAKVLNSVLQCSLIALTAKSMPLSKILLYSFVETILLSFVYPACCSDDYLNTELRSHPM